MQTAQNVEKNLRNIGESIVKNEDHTEGKLTKTIESQTAKLPSMTFLGLAVGSMAISAGFTFFSKKKEIGNFIGLWAPCFMLMGIYNKLVKEGGSDQFHRNGE